MRPAESIATADCALVYTSAESVALGHGARVCRASGRVTATLVPRSASATGNLTFTATF